MKYTPSCDECGVPLQLATPEQIRDWSLAVYFCPKCKNVWGDEGA